MDQVKRTYRDVEANVKKGVRGIDGTDPWRLRCGPRRDRPKGGLLDRAHDHSWRRAVPGRPLDVARLEDRGVGRRGGPDGLRE